MKTLMSLGTPIKDFKFIRIEYIGKSKTGKTNLYEVVAKDDAESSLGVIKWHAGWRRYALFPQPNTFWEVKCLEDITKFLNELWKK
jgi:hypothetical protein